MDGMLRAWPVLKGAWGEHKEQRIHAPELCSDISSGLRRHLRHVSPLACTGGCHNRSATGKHLCVRASAARGEEEEGWRRVGAHPRSAQSTPKTGGEDVPSVLASQRGFGVCCALLVGCRAVNVFKNGAEVTLGWILLGKHFWKGEDVVLERRACRAVAPVRDCEQDGAVGSPKMPPRDATPDLLGPSPPASRPRCPWGSCAGGEREKHFFRTLQVMNLFLEKTSSPAWS